MPEGTFRIVRGALCCVVITTGVIAMTGCRRDVRLAGRNIPDVKVQTVTHYGVTLDESASPEQVAYVALRAIADDFRAASADARDAALAIQFDVCAANIIASRNRTSVERKEHVYNIVYRWTPTVAHYVADFPTDWESAKSRLRRGALTRTKSGAGEIEEAAVVMEVDDPSGDPRARVVLVVFMAKDGGYWRVIHLGFDPNRRTIT